MMARAAPHGADSGKLITILNLPTLDGRRVIQAAGTALPSALR